MSRKITVMRGSAVAFVIVSVLVFHIQPTNATIKTLQEHGQEKWSIKTPMPTSRNRFAIATVDGKIYCLGGYSEYDHFSDLNDVYDPKVNNWTSNQPMPYGCYGCAAAVVNGRIYVIGGQRWSSSSGTMNIVQGYDPNSETWIIKSPMPTARYDLAVGVVNNKIYAIGGYQWGTGSQLNTVEEYDTLNNTWTTKASMPTSRSKFAVAVLGNKMYAIGGFGAGSEPLDVVEVYDPSTDLWTTCASLPTSRHYLAASVVNGKIYAMGGYNAGLLDVNEEYDTLTNTWQPRLSIPTARWGLGTVSVDKKIYAIGGTGSTGANEEYTPRHAWITACNHAGQEKGIFNFSENVYVLGGNFPSETNITIYIIPDNLSALSNNSIVTCWNLTDFSGELNLTLAWIEPLTEGHYDIWVDVNQNGMYDETIDIYKDLVLDIYAFTVIPEFTPLFIMPLFLMATLLAVIAYKKKALTRIKLD